MKYLDKVSDNELIEFLSKNKINPGFFFDKEGNPLPVIQRGENVVIFRGKLKDDELSSFINKGLESILSTELLKFSRFNAEDCCVIFNDFNAMTDYRTDIQEAYAYFMYDKFGEEYRKDYNAEVIRETEERERKEKQSNKLEDREM